MFRAAHQHFFFNEEIGGGKKNYTLFQFLPATGQLF